MDDSINTIWPRTRGAEDEKMLKVMLVAHLETLDKDIERGFGRLREVVGMVKGEG